jgi:hypothetical protein
MERIPLSLVRQLDLILESTVFATSVEFYIGGLDLNLNLERLENFSTRSKARSEILCSSPSQTSTCSAFPYI